MFAVEVYAAVRQFVFVDGKSRREAARVWFKPGHDCEDVPVFDASGIHAGEACVAARGPDADRRRKYLI